MLRIIKQTLIFISIFFCLILLIDVITSHLINKKAKFNLISQPEKIFIGHSHPECAYNDSLILNFKNLAQSSETYFYTFFKTKNILEQNKSIKVVFIEFTNNQIEYKMNDWTWDDEHILHRYPIFSSFLSAKEKLFLFKNNPLGFINSFSVSLKKRIDKLLTKNYDFSNELGGYLYLERNKTDSLLKISSKTLLTDTIINCKKYIPKINLYYLSKTIELCLSKRKKVFLVRSPIHEKYKGFYNESIYNELILNRFRKIEFLDFSKFPLSNSEYGDLEHLNHKGAKIFSIWFDNLLKDGLLTKKDKQKFINEKIITFRLNTAKIK